MPNKRDRRRSWKWSGLPDGFNKTNEYRGHKISGCYIDYPNRYLHDGTGPYYDDDGCLWAQRRPVPRESNSRWIWTGPKEGKPAHDNMSGTIAHFKGTASELKEAIKEAKGNKHYITMHCSDKEVPLRVYTHSSLHDESPRNILTGRRVNIDLNPEEHPMNIKESRSKFGIHLAAKSVDGTTTEDKDRSSKHVAATLFKHIVGNIYNPNISECIHDDIKELAVHHITDGMDAENMSEEEIEEIVDNVMTISDVYLKYIMQARGDEKDKHDDDRPIATVDEFVSSIKKVLDSHGHTDLATGTKLEQFLEIDLDEHDTDLIDDLTSVTDRVTNHKLIEAILDIVNEPNEENGEDEKEAEEETEGEVIEKDHPEERVSKDQTDIFNLLNEENKMYYCMQCEIEGREPIKQNLSVMGRCLDCIDNDDPLYELPEYKCRSCGKFGSEEEVN